MIKEIKKSNRRLCKSKNLEEVYVFKKTPIGDDYRHVKIKHRFL